MSPLPTLKPWSILGKEFGVAEAVPGFAAPDATLLERSDIGCLLINCACDASAVVGQLEAVVGFALPRECGRATQMPPYAALWLTPRSWLLQCSPDEELHLAQQINAAFADMRLHASLFTDYLGWFELSGEGAFALLSEGGFVSLERAGLEVGHAKRTVLAGIAAVVMRSRPDAWLLGVERSRSRYFVDWLESAAARSSLADDPLSSSRLCAGSWQGRDAIEVKQRAPRVAEVHDVDGGEFDDRHDSAGMREQRRR